MRGLFVSLVLTAAAGAYDLADFAAFSREWQTCRHLGYTPAWDLDGSGCVEQNDLVLFANRWLMPTNLIVNGGFDGSSGWTIGGNWWSISDGSAVCAPVIVPPNIPQLPDYLIGTFSAVLEKYKLYRLSVLIKNVTYVNYGVECIFWDDDNNPTVVKKISLVGLGEKKCDFLAPATMSSIFGIAPAPWPWIPDQFIEIDDVSVIDLTVGSNLVVNGDFNTLSNWNASGWVAYSDSGVNYARWSESSNPVGYELTQTISVQPNTTYIFAFYNSVFGELEAWFGSLRVVLSEQSDRYYCVKYKVGNVSSVPIRFIAKPFHGVGDYLLTGVRVYEALEPLSDVPTNNHSTTNAVSAFLAGKAMGWLP